MIHDIRGDLILLGEPYPLAGSCSEGEGRACWSEEGREYSSALSKVRREQYRDLVCHIPSLFRLARSKKINENVCAGLNTAIDLAWIAR